MKGRRKNDKNTANLVVIMVAFLIVALLLKGVGVSGKTISVIVASVAIFLFLPSFVENNKF